jgi:hypothetical protein
MIMSRKDKGNPRRRTQKCTANSQAVKHPDRNGEANKVRCKAYKITVLEDFGAIFEAE